MSSTKAEKVIPVLQDIYNTFGNPQKQISDNGAPFNSKSMDVFAAKRGISLQKIPPLHPSSNPVETFMRPLGKTMKIAHHSNKNEKEAINTLLNNYRNTPHPATGVPPSAMLFRDGENSIFPRQSATQEEIDAARKRDVEQKQEHELKLNDQKYKTRSQFKEDDHVLIRNYRKASKFDPIFMPEQYKIAQVSDQGRCLTLERIKDCVRLKRHPDDVKKYDGEFDQENTVNTPSESETLQQYMSKFAQMADNYEEWYDDCEEPNYAQVQGNVRRSARNRQQNTRYYNENFVNS